ncbi:MAG: glycosyltransferase family 39 protein [Candidatus Eisenbacteria bacterium]
MEGSARIRRPPARDLLVLILVVLLAAAIRGRLLDVPLERDEGEYAYAGRLILEGVPPYVGIYNMKLPGIYAAYAATLGLFGESARGIHTGLLVVNAATIFALYFLARKFLGRGGALAASAVFSLLSVGRAVQGIFANAEHFVILPATLGLLLVLEATERRSFALPYGAGLLLGLAFLTKQHAAAFLLLGGTILLAGNLLRREGRDGAAGEGALSPRLSFALFAAGAATPYGITCLLFALVGAFGDFWFWTVTYASAYVSQVPISRLAPNLFARFADQARHAPALWILVAGGGLALALRRWPGRRPAAVALFAIFSVAATAPGLYFRPHYFILLLPAASILAGGAVEAAGALSTGGGSMGRRAAPVLLLLALGLSVYGQRSYLFEMTPDEACRSTYGLNPFVESVEIARYIAERTDRDDRIAVIGSEPQICFYADRRSATGFVYTYALMENHRYALDMQRKMIAEIEAAAPRYIVYVRNRHSWDARPDSPTALTDWFGGYRDAHYDLVGLVDMVPTTSTYRWGPPLPWPPRSEFWIGILERTR